MSCGYCCFRSIPYRRQCLVPLTHTQNAPGELWRRYKTIIFCNFCRCSINPFTARFSQKQFSTKFRNFILWNLEKQIAPCVSTGREVSFEWSPHRIWTADSNVRVTLQNSIKQSGSERVEKLAQLFLSFSDIHPWHPL